MRYRASSRRSNISRRSHEHLFYSSSCPLIGFVSVATIKQRTVVTNHVQRAQLSPTSPKNVFLAFLSNKSGHEVLTACVVVSRQLLPVAGKSLAQTTEKNTERDKEPLSSPSLPKTLYRFMAMSPPYPGPSISDT